MANAAAVISGRNYLVYSVPWSATTRLPLNTVPYGTTWGTPTGQTGAWADRGYTSGGLGFNMNVARGEIRVDQEFDPIVRPITTRTIQLTTSFAEMSPANIQLASGMGTLDTANANYTDLIIGATVADSYNSWGFDIYQPDTFAFRIFLPKGIATGTPSPRFTPDAAALIALQVDAVVDTSTNPSRVATVRDSVSTL